MTLRKMGAQWRSQDYTSGGSKNDDAMAIREYEAIHLRFDVLDLNAWEFLQCIHLNLVVKVTNVANDGIVLHLLHVLQGDDLEVACGCDEDVDVADSLFQSGHLEAFHACLQCADGIALCDVDTGTAATQGKSAALANVTIAADHGALASDHNISGPHDGVWERVAAAINVVELGLCYAIVHIDGREKELTLRSHFLQTVDSGGGFL